LAHTIAVSGKGGVGKTTLSAAMIRCLTLDFGKAVLAVDADPNSSLGPLLGQEPERTVADIREDVRAERVRISPGMSKDRQIEYMIQTCVVEGRKYDLLTMGHPEGPSCYCYVNNLLRKFIDEVSGDYPYVVVDNEAGMEHLSRRTTNRVDELLIVSEATALGLRTTRRILEIAASLQVIVKHKFCVLSRVQKTAPEHVLKEFSQLGLEVVATIPYDAKLYDVAAGGGSIFEVPPDSAALVAVKALVEARLLNEA